MRSGAIFLPTYRHWLEQQCPENKEETEVSAIEQMGGLTASSVSQT
jgi:hypothetical protein